MELRQVELFLAVARAGSITAASKEAGMTQPALSRQVKSLEEALGVTLLERGAHSISLTPAGEALVDGGGRWVEQASRLMARVRATGAAEVIRIGYAPSLVGSLLGRVIGRFCQMHPGVRVKLHDCSTAEMKEGLADGRYEMILTVPSDKDRGGIRWEPVIKRGWRLAMEETHPLAREKVIGVEELEGKRLLIYDRGQYPDYWERVSGYFREQGVNPTIAGEFDGFSSMAAALEGGMGVALVAEPEQALESGTGTVVFRDLEPAPAAICVAAGLKEGRVVPAAVAVFIEEFRRVSEISGNGGGKPTSR